MYVDLSVFSIGVACGLVVGLAVLWDGYGRYNAVMAGVKMLTIGAVASQLVNNAKMGSDMERVISPFFPCTHPLVVFAATPLFHMVDRALSATPHLQVGMRILAGFHVALALMYCVWIMQYAVYADSNTTPVYYSVGVAYIVGGLALARYYRTHTTEDIDKSYMLVPPAGNTSSVL
jgi:hypothetical protein